MLQDRLRRLVTTVQSARQNTLQVPPLDWLTQYRIRLGGSFRRSAGTDPEGLGHITTLMIRVHWLIGAIGLIELVYRPDYGIVKFSIYSLILLTLIACTAYIHYRYRSNGPVTWHWLLALCTIDVLLVSAAVATSDGFGHPFSYLFYYPALAVFALIFTSFWLNMAWVTMVSLIYVSLSFGVGAGLDISERDEKALVARIALMYIVVGVINLAYRFERIRLERAAEREREFERERLELSRTIHDTVAQTAYMVGIGVDRARKLAEGQEELRSTLDATSHLSKSVLWELRRPLDGVQIHQGARLGIILQSHADTFTTVTSVPTEVVLRGIEPALGMEVRSRLFSIAHNALSNAFRHAQAGRVEVEVEFANESIYLSVADDGVGLPNDYTRRGHGFAGMSADAEAIGGSLIVETGGRRGGTIVTCTVPL